MNYDWNPLDDPLLQELRRSDPIDRDTLPSPSDPEPARLLEEILTFSTEDGTTIIFPTNPSKGELSS